MAYLNRQDAAERLTQVLRHLKGTDTVVLALPRGGIVLGAEVARELEAPLGLVLVRKIGHPLYPEYAIGALAEDEKPIYNENERATINTTWLKQAENSARDLINYRHTLYYGKDIALPEVTSKVVILVDDGIATGLTVHAAVLAIKHKHAKSIIVAVPVASRESVDELEDIVDEVIVLEDPDDFLGAVAAHYQEFEQVNDEEVRELLWEVNDELQHKTSTNPPVA
jgi:predicted phosphoribosyltransferase